jgi:hypothetical protein
MLFPDADKDGLPDAWEIANGSNPNVYDRDSIKAGTGTSFLDLYMASLWPAPGVNGSSPILPSGGIPPLTIDSEAPHQAVGALKGSLAVGADGAATYSIPIEIPKGTAGMEPKLSLGYSSSSGNGIAGLGWNIGGLQRITRGNSSAAKDGSHVPVGFGNQDRFFLDGERLVCISGTYGAAGSEYRTELDSYARITAVGAGPQYWQIQTKAGLVVKLGETLDSKLAVTPGTLAWCVNRVEDTLGNYYSVEYARDLPTTEFDFFNHRVSKLKYTGNALQGLNPYCSIDFSYDWRPDASRSFSTWAGSLVDLRLSKIRVLTGNDVNHSYRLNYTHSYQSGRSLLTSVVKCMNDDLSGLVLPTTLNYDGLQTPASGSTVNPLWRDSGTASLPAYGTNIDATGDVNSMVNLESGDPSRIKLTGDVARAYRLPIGMQQIYSDSTLRFEFNSSKITVGAFIGVDADTTYQSVATTNLHRIGGNGSTVKFDGVTFSGTTHAYNVSEGWKAITANLGSLGTGSRPYLVLICVDNDVSDGVDVAEFRNIRIYRNGSQVYTDVAPLVFDIDTELPRYADSEGKDLGVVTVDLDSDGLPDLADWRAVDYSVSAGVATAVTQGHAHKNLGDGFGIDPSILPPAFLPLSSRSTDGNGNAINQKHRLLAQPMDVDGDGNTDLMGAVDIRNSTGYLKNEYAFYGLTSTGWTEKTGWRLPFYMDNVASSVDQGGRRRDEHFQWVDLNCCGPI